MRRLVAEALEPAVLAARKALRDTGIALVAGFLALIGVVLLMSAACVALVPFVGTAGALALTGLGFLLVAAGLLLMRRPARPLSVQDTAPPPPNPQPDPLMQLVFDLSFNVGRVLTRRRK